MANKQLALWLGGLALATLAVGGAMAAFFPNYIQSILASSNGGYISELLFRHQLKNPQRYTAEFYSTYVPEVIIRILGLGYVIAAAVLLLVTKGRRYLIDFWNHSSTAFNMGVFRISLMWIFHIFDMSPLNNLLNLTSEGMNIPIGYRWLAPVLPPPAWLVHGMWDAYNWLVIVVMVGFLTRFTVPILTFVSFFVLLGPQLVGKMNHYHHIWLALLFLNFTTSGDSLSVDALIRKLRGKPFDHHRYDQKYGRPFVYVWIVMGAVYFFPGFWKFAASGFAWAFSDNVQLKILAKIYETGQQPVIPLYNYPVLCKIGGLATLFFEISFPFAMVFPKLRLLYGFGGIGFHESNRRITQIGFTSIEFLYPSFIDWSALVKRKWGEVKTSRYLAPRWQTVTGVFTVAMLWVAGFVAVESWPWAVYPTFAPLEQHFVNSIEMRVATEDSKVQSILLQEDPTLIASYSNRTRLRSYMTILMMKPESDERAKMLKSLFDLWRKDHVHENVREVEFWQVQVPLLPLGAPPVPYKILGKL